MEAELRTIGIVISTVLGLAGVGSVVVGVVQAINNTLNTAKEYVDKKAESVSSEFRAGDKALMDMLSKLVESSAQDSKLFVARINEIDLWRKEINGQLKLISQAMEFTNKLLDEGQAHVRTLADGQHQINVSLARIAEFIESQKQRKRSR
jgi:uncharacterized phage infection (PIP) family protein YhgE